MPKNLNMEVLTLGSHLIITLALVVSYVVVLALGHTDGTLQNMVMLSGGFWFGMSAKSAMSKKTDKKEDTGSEQ